MTITAGTSPVTEGTAATFTVTASPAPTTAITVSVNTSEDGNVISGTPDETVTIDANETTATLTVATDDDQIDEPNSEVTAQLQGGTGYAVGTPSSATVTVEDNDISPPGTPQMTITAGTSPVTEGTAATFTVTASPAPTTAITVSVNTSEDGNVISGTPPSTVTIDANETTATLTVATDNDQIDEPNSEVTAKLQGGTGYAVGTPSSATVTVEDNDISPPGTPQVTITADTSPVTAKARLRHSHTALTAEPCTSTTAITVSVNTSEDGNVISGTPMRHSQSTTAITVTIDANETTATLTVATDNDQIDEPNSEVTAKLQGGTGYAVGTPSSATVTVEDNDISPPGTPQVTITADTSPVTEGTAATFTVTASPAPTTAITVNVNVTETEDVISGTPPSTVTIDANETTATLTVATDNDQIDEPNSEVTAKLQGGTGYAVGTPSSATVTVEDNDISPPGTPQVTITAGTSPVTEGTAATFTVTASPAPTTAITVSVNTSEDGNVISGTPDETVTIDANETTATLTVATDNDQIDEPNSEVTAKLQGGTGYAIGTPSSATVTVEDNDISPPGTPQVTITAGTSPVTEGTDATFTITASPAPTTAITVSVTVTETEDVHQRHTALTVTIGTTGQATLTVATHDDDVGEDDSEVTAKLQGGTGYAVGTPSSATVTVEDNDISPPGTPQVTITAGTSPVTEGADATFTITATPAPTTELTVNVNVTETGNILSGTPDATVTINPNQTTATLTVATQDDDLDKHASVVTAQLQAGTGYTVGTPSSAQVTVRDNDLTLSRQPIDVTLRSLTINPGKLKPAFDPATLTYTASVANATSTVTAIANHPDASVSINGQNTTTLDVSLVEGKNNITVVVTAQDNSTQLTYTITVTRAAPVVPQVTITADEASITEGEATTFTVKATPAPTIALTVNVNVTETGNILSGTPSSTVTISANETTATLTVATDDDNVDEEASVITAALQAGTGYTVGDPSSASVLALDNELPPSMDATLSSLTINPGKLKPAFDPATLSYTASVANAVSTVTVTATANNADASVSINGQNTTTLDVSLVEGANTITVTVTAQDNSTQLTYTITVTRAAPGVPQVTITTNTTSVTEGEAATFTDQGRPLHPQSRCNRERERHPDQQCLQRHTEVNRHHQSQRDHRHTDGPYRK